MISILRKLACFGLSAVLFGACSTASANSLAVGQTIIYSSGSPLSTVDLGALNLVASTGPVIWQIPTVRSNPFEAGTAIEEVFATAGGTLDFAYQFTETSARLKGGSVISIEMDSFTSVLNTVFSTAADYSSSVIPPGFSTPTPGVADSGKVSRSSDGSAITFGGPLTPNVGKSQSSPIFVIATNAKTYLPGNFSLQDSGTTNIPGFEPFDSFGTSSSVALPKTSSTILILLGCVCGFGAIRRRMAVA